MDKDITLPEFMKKTVIDMHNAIGMRMDKETLWRIVSGKYKGVTRSHFESAWILEIENMKF